MSQGTATRRMLSSVLLSSVVLTLFVSEPSATVRAQSTSRSGEASAWWICNAGSGVAALKCQDSLWQLSRSVSVHPTSKPTPIVSVTVKVSIPTAVTQLESCSGGGLPVIGYVSGSMHWVDGIPNDSCYASQSAPYDGVLSLWKVPPAPFNRVYYPSPSAFPYRGGWPTCSWWARETGVDFGASRGTYGSVPRVGATIVYAPGVLGAGSDGHYGHVVQVYTNGWILTSEMNFYWNGGGSGRVIFRFIPWHTSGISFIY